MDGSLDGNYHLAIIVRLSLGLSWSSGPLSYQDGVHSGELSDRVAGNPVIAPIDHHNQTRPSCS